MTTSADSADSRGKAVDAGDSPAPAAEIYNWCHAGEHYDVRAVPCQHIEAGSGPGYSINACPDHMRARGWKPLVPVHTPLQP